MKAVDAETHIFSFLMDMDDPEAHWIDTPVFYVHDFTTSLPRV